MPFLVSMIYLPNVLLVTAAAFPAIVFVAAYNELVGATGLMRTFPFPDRLKLKKPSPPSAADERFFLETTLFLTDPEHA